MLHQILVYSKLEGILHGSKSHEMAIDSHFPEKKHEIHMDPAKIEGCGQILNLY